MAIRGGGRLLWPALAVIAVAATTPAAAELPTWRNSYDVHFDLELSTDQISWWQGFDQAAYDITAGDTMTIFYRISNSEYSLEPLEDPWAQTSPTPGIVPEWAYTSFRDYTSEMVCAVDGLAPGATASGIVAEFDWGNIGPADFGDGWEIRFGVGNSNVDYDQTAIDWSLIAWDLAFEVDATVAVNQPVRFTASRSSSVDRYRWDFDGDGTWDTDWSSERLASHVYTTEGMHRAILQASDGTSTTWCAEDNVECTPEPVTAALLVCSGAFAIALKRRRAT